MRSAPGSGGGAHLVVAGEAAAEGLGALVRQADPLAAAGAAHHAAALAAVVPPHDHVELHLLAVLARGGRVVGHPHGRVRVRRFFAAFRKKNICN